MTDRSKRRDPGAWRRALEPQLILPALAVVVGAAISGFAVYVATTAAERARTERDEEKDAALARGAARLLINEYYSAGIYLQTTLGARRTLPVDDKFTVSLARADEREIAARLTSAEWEEVSLANGLIDQAVVIIREIGKREPGSRDGGAPLLPGDDRVLTGTLDQIERARQALRGLAG